MAELTVIGVPSSAGSYAAGQDQAPRALRSAGLLAALAESGVPATDAGDLAEQVWAPDPASATAQNEVQVVESVVELAGKVSEVLADDGRVLVVGGNCTIAVGAVAGLREHSSAACGLVYVDRHFDMNTPTSTNEGALDWMGVAHLLDLPGALTSFAGAFQYRPILPPKSLTFLGIDPSQATDFEKDHVRHMAIPVIPQSDVIADPAAAARSALAAIPDLPLVVHVDVDVLDFTDAPLAENTSGRNIGPSLAQLADAVGTLVADPRWRILTIGEINPTRSAGLPDLLPRFNRMLARVLASHASWS